MDKMEHLKNDDEVMSELEREEWALWEENSIREYATKTGYKEGMEAGFNDGFNAGFNDGFSDGFNKGVNQGIEQGVSQNKVEMIKKMLINKIDYDVISKVSGKSLDEIKKIEESL